MTPSKRAPGHKQAADAHYPPNPPAAMTDGNWLPSGGLPWNNQSNPAHTDARSTCAAANCICEPQAPRTCVVEKDVHLPRCAARVAARTRYEIMGHARPLAGVHVGLQKGCEAHTRAVHTSDHSMLLQQTQKQR
jgi:hypothetical protein